MPHHAEPPAPPLIHLTLNAAETFDNFLALDILATHAHPPNLEDFQRLLGAYASRMRMVSGWAEGAGTLHHLQVVTANNERYRLRHRTAPLFEAAYRFATQQPPYTMDVHGDYYVDLARTDDD